MLICQVLLIIFPLVPAYIVFYLAAVSTFLPYTFQLPTYLIYLFYTINKNHHLRTYVNQNTH